jgi:hypothetical protein
MHSPDRTERDAHRGQRRRGGDAGRWFGASLRRAGKRPGQRDHRHSRRDRRLRQEKNGIGKAILHKGTFEVNLKAIGKKLNNAKPTIANTTTCSFVFSATAPVTLFNGTGAYKNIKGTLMLTETFAGYGPFYKTGKHKGKCNTSNNATPIAQWGSVTGVGTVKFG